MAGTPSSTLPSTMKASAETRRKPTFPPGTSAIRSTSWREKPDCVSAHAIAVAAPTTSRIAPDSDGRLDQDRIDPAPVELPINEHADQDGVDDADGGDFRRGRDPLDHGRPDHDRQAEAREARSGTACPSSPQVNAARRRDVLAPASGMNTTTASAIMPTTAGSRPPVNRAAIETPVTEPTVISTMHGGIVSDMTAEADEQRGEVALPVAALDHLGKQRRRDRRHVGRLRARNAGDEIHRAEQHILQPAAQVPDQRNQKGDHRPWPGRRSRSARRAG